MCSGRCSRFIAGFLYPLVLISMICNVLLFFPGWKAEYALERRLTPEVLYMGGLVGGGLAVLVPALFIHLTGNHGCCANRCGMFLSIGFSVIGVAGALYSFIVAILGLNLGPYCRNAFFLWGRPFQDSSEMYLTNLDQWTICKEPENVVAFNVGLFSTLLLVSCLELVLCFCQMLNGLVGCICGTQTQ
ncbi:transmembrane 4 L6 family member 4-like [Salminus brasiliensis]|uniref:transmembrane 4 L6 family member 4-like n=1 Tax=Salminus brasiliensis TaxID=930266 RepID=UPI003B83A001